MLKTPTLSEFEQAVMTCRPSFVTFAFRLLGGREDAEDAVQAALARALHALRSGVTPVHLRAWIYKFVLREAQHSTERSSVRRRALSSGALAPPEAAPAAPDPEEQTRLQQRLLAEVYRLPEDYRKIILLRYCQHLSCEETSEALDMAVGTVKSYQGRALRLLRERLSPMVDPEV